MTPITIVGNLTDDPELRFTPSGAALVKFAVAVNRRTFDRAKNEWTDAGTDFHYVTAWKQLAENIAATLQKGMRVIVQGELRQRHWTDETTQQKRSAWELNAAAVGPDLTWAAATVRKTSRTGNGAPADDPWATGSPQRPAAAATGNGYSDEPPF
ncbi:single-stranded DNA-binding protein [Streptomyces sp. MBT57]|nr:single-stranded DNA-binding protein [Streptomyces sp. MBT57]